MAEAPHVLRLAPVAVVEVVVTLLLTPVAAAAVSVVVRLIALCRICGFGLDDDLLLRLLGLLRLPDERVIEAWSVFAALDPANAYFARSHTSCI